MDIKDVAEGKRTITAKLSKKKVLLLNDVEEEEHIDAFVDNWLGNGSKIIITTRNKSVLNVPEVHCSYELPFMNLDQSLQLFSKHAFRRDSPLKDYIVQSNRAIGIARGLPLAPEVIGSLLCRTQIEMWDVKLEKLESIPPDGVSNKLKISFDAVILPQLRWLSWKNIPLTFNITNFFMDEVVILDLSHSKITDDWKGWSHMEVMKKLKSLDLSYCKNFQRLPNKWGSNLARLEYLYLRGCESLEMLPDTIGNLKLLIELDISDTSMKELPDSIGNLKNLKVVKMRGSGMRKIPDAFWTIDKLEEVKVDNIYENDVLHVRIGDGITRNQSLRILRLIGASIHELPQKLPESLIELRLDLLHTEMLPDLSSHNNLKELDLTFLGLVDINRYVFAEDPMIGNLSESESQFLSVFCETAQQQSLASLLNSNRFASWALDSIASRSFPRVYPPYICTVARHFARWRMYRI